MEFHPYIVEACEQPWFVSPFGHEAEAACGPGAHAREVRLDRLSELDPSALALRLVETFSFEARGDALGFDAARMHHSVDGAATRLSA